MVTSKSYGVVGGLAECRDSECEFRTEGKNALANGSKHHKKTGHEVHVEQTTHVVYKTKYETL